VSCLVCRVSCAADRTAIDFTTGEGAGSAGLQAGGVVVPGAAPAVGLGMPRPIVKVVEGTKRPRSKWDQGEPAAGAKPGASQPAATTTTTTSGSRYAEYAYAHVCRGVVWRPRVSRRVVSCRVRW
jgi:hypothetical protein